MSKKMANNVEFSKDKVIKDKLKVVGEDDTHLRSKLWDAQRLVRIILGNEKKIGNSLSSSSSSSSSRLFEGKDILKAIRTFAQLKTELEELKVQYQSENRHYALESITGGGGGGSGVGTGAGTALSTRSSDEVSVLNNTDSSSVSFLSQRQPLPPSQEHFITNSSIVSCSTEITKKTATTTTIHDNNSNSSNSSSSSNIIKPITSKSLGNGEIILNTIKENLNEWELKFDQLNRQHEEYVLNCQVQLEQIYICLHNLEKSNILDSSKIINKTHEQLQNLVLMVSSFPSTKRLKQLQLQLQKVQKQEEQSKKELLLLRKQLYEYEKNYQKQQQQQQFVQNNRNAYYYQNNQNNNETLKHSLLKRSWQHMVKKMKFQTFNPETCYIVNLDGENDDASCLKQGQQQQQLNDEVKIRGNIYPPEQEEQEQEQEQEQQQQQQNKINTMFPLHSMKKLRKVCQKVINNNKHNGKNDEDDENMLENFLMDGPPRELVCLDDKEEERRGNGGGSGNGNDGIDSEVSDVSTSIIFPPIKATTTTAMDTYYYDMDMVLGPEKEYENEELLGETEEDDSWHSVNSYLVPSENDDFSSSNLFDNDDDDFDYGELPYGLKQSLEKEGFSNILEALEQALTQEIPKH